MCVWAGRPLDREEGGWCCHEIDSCVGVCLLDVAALHVLLTRRALTRVGPCAYTHKPTCVQQKCHASIIYLVAPPCATCAMCTAAIHRGCVCVRDAAGLKVQCLSPLLSPVCAYKWLCVAALCVPPSLKCVTELDFPPNKWCPGPSHKHTASCALEVNT